MKKIYLYEGRGKARKQSDTIFVMVDDEDYDYLNQWQWGLMKIYHTEKKLFYVRRYEGSYRKGQKFAFLMHREIMKSDMDRRLVVDHIDGNGLNNQKSNLRKCTYAQNLANRSKDSNGKHRYRGIQKYFHKNGVVRWKAQCTFDGIKWKQSGFITDDLAAIAYNEKAKEMKGEYAKQNTIRWH